MKAKLQGPSAAPKTSPRTSAPPGPFRLALDGREDQPGIGRRPRRLSPTAKKTAARA